MDLPEDKSHSFMIRIWLERTVEETGYAKWRGHITHVYSGERRYVENLNGITAFIATYLERMGADDNPKFRWLYWLKHRMSKH
jgi:hypothetical protein